MKELHGWQEEQRSAHLYRVLAEMERGSPRERLFRELAREAAAQSQIWADAARKAGQSVPVVYRPDLRTRIVERLTRQLGPRHMRAMLAAMKVRGMSVYGSVDPGHPMPDTSSGLERRHRGLAGGGNLRAAVFGVNDGLVSNASLILGVAGASADPGIILLSGVAGLLAGAFSMASGEYVSVRSQREMYEYQIGLERDELKAYPDEEAKELALIYEARGLAWDEAKRLADSMIADPERGLDTLAREELGLNPEELGSPFGAAAFSFLSFAAGALIPLLPFLFGRGPSMLVISITLTGLSLFGVGSTLSLFTGRSALRGGVRMLLIGAAAGALTFAIGRLLGVGLA
ncbi:MAG TPA: VIT1/CCC1 transporter family protein [Burkholderiales bacterium]|nr:VIT1/CCC1 transporter family protein [Burkholderiales bacterium]HXY76599.1 VIT1/CCC1 transporter family protein [Steroidobacteraceae bacterium]